MCDDDDKDECVSCDVDQEFSVDLSIYENKSGLSEDMKFLASMPELCDITFLVGETREPVCAVGAVLAARSRVFRKLLYGEKTRKTNTLSVTSPINGNNKEDFEDHSSYGLNEKEKLFKYTKSKRIRENKDNKLKLFLKRSSEPTINGLPSYHHQLSVKTHQTMIIEEFEPDVFRQLIEYIHTGCVTLQARTLLGLTNAADYYGLEELRKASMGFVSCCITVDTVCTLLASAERYIQYKCTKTLIQRVLEFVDNHGDEVLSLVPFALLPEHVIRLILSREQLKADEYSKFQAALLWSQRYCENYPSDLREVMSVFLECIEFYKIPAAILMRDIHPLGVVPDDIMMNALAYQADPKSVDMRKIESPNRFRRMTLPHALNIAGSDLLALDKYHEKGRSASTSNTTGHAISENLANLDKSTNRKNIIKGKSNQKLSEKEKDKLRSRGENQ